MGIIVGKMIDKIKAEINKYQFWTTIIIIICITLVVITCIIIYHPYTIRFEMDNNSLEAIKSINWSALPK